MLEEEKYIKSATSYLCTLSDYTDTMSSLNLHDTSVIQENFFSRVLNLVFDYELENINKIKQNASAIDLYDNKKRLSVQVTSTSSLTKVKDCLKKFQEKELNKEYDTLKIYILTKKQKSYKIDDVEIGKFKFSSKVDIIDKEDILRAMLNLPLATQKEIVDLLFHQITPLKEESEPSNEVITLVKLINRLSDMVTTESFDENTEIDPKQKIPLRFKDNTEDIEDDLFELSITYEPILASILKNNEIDSLMHSKVSTYLKIKSRKILKENNMDANQSLDVLQDEIIKNLNLGSYSYDEMAVRFFLLKHLTACNVFPLSRSERLAHV
ncbi:SMEK domain-containing protein [Vibrio metschnikovii]|nr:SMEK domain-containing protein [Vibrio metschnikovii]